VWILLYYIRDDYFRRSRLRAYAASARLNNFRFNWYSARPYFHGFYSCAVVHPPVFTSRTIRTRFAGAFNRQPPGYGFNGNNVIVYFTDLPGRSSKTERVVFMYGVKMYITRVHDVIIIIIIIIPFYVNPRTHTHVRPRLLNTFIYIYICCWLYKISRLGSGIS